VKPSGPGTFLFRMYFDYRIFTCSRFIQICCFFSSPFLVVSVFLRFSAFHLGYLICWRTAVHSVLLSFSFLKISRNDLTFISYFNYLNSLFPWSVCLYICCFVDLFKEPTFGFEDFLFCFLLICALIFIVSFCLLWV